MLLVQDLNDLKTYLHGMFYGRPGDHHPRIDHAAVSHFVPLTLTGAIVAVADAGSIKIREGSKGTANTCWFEVSGRYYVLVHNYHHAGVDLRSGGLQGRTVATFRNENTADTVWPVFSRL